MKKILLLFFYALLATISFGQNEDEIKDKKIAEIPKETDFSVPASPAFILLDITPAKVNKPGFAKDFKFDWVFSGNTISPNIAIEAQPVWLLFYKHKSLVDYKKEKRFAKQFSSLSLSIGTIKKDSLQSLGWGLKVNLWRQKKSDPMENNDFFDALKSVISLSPEEKSTWIILEAKKEKLESEKSDIEKQKLQKEIEQLTIKLSGISEEDKKNIKQVKKAFADKYWNASMVDIGYGNIYNYFGERLDTLKFQQKSSGIWINGAYNFKSKSFLLSGLYKYINSDTSTHFAGLNLRYGSSKFNFFVEYVYELKGNDKKNTIAYGGDFKVSNQLQIQFGIRTEYNKEFSLKSLKPLINLNWLLKDKE